MTHMKKINLFVFTFLVSIVLFMTSCVSSGNSSSDTYYSTVAQMHYDTGGAYYYFTAEGYTLIPSETSLSNVRTKYSFSAKSDMTYIVYTFDKTANPNYQTTKTLSVELQGAVALIGTTVLTTRGANNDSTIVKTTTMPILNPVSLNSVTSYPFLIANNTYLLLGANYYVTDPYNTYPYFTVVYYPSETKSGDTTLNLYLAFSSTDKGLTYQTSNIGSAFPGLFIKSFNIADVLSNFKNTTGKDPTTVCLKATVSEEWSMNKSDWTTGTYSADYKSVCITE